MTYGRNYSMQGTSFCTSEIVSSHKCISDQDQSRQLPNPSLSSSWRNHGLVPVMERLLFWADRVCVDIHLPRIYARESIISFWEPASHVWLQVRRIFCVVCEGAIFLLEPFSTPGLEFPMWRFPRGAVVYVRVECFNFAAAISNSDTFSRAVINLLGYEHRFRSMCLDPSGFGTVYQLHIVGRVWFL